MKTPKQIKSPVLTEIDEQVKQRFKGRNHTYKQRDGYLISLLCHKVAELETIIQNKG